MGTYAQALDHARPTATTILARVRRRHGYHPLPGTCCLERADAQERCPSGVRNGLCQMRVREQIGRRQVLVLDRVVRAHERARRLVLVIGALALDGLMGCRASSVTAFLRRLLPFCRRLTRRCALASRFSPLR